MLGLRYPHGNVAEQQLQQQAQLGQRRQEQIQPLQAAQPKQIAPLSHQDPHQKQQNLQEKGIQGGKQATVLCYPHNEVNKKSYQELKLGKQPVRILSDT